MNSVLTEIWKKEIPSQFQGKPNLSAVIDAFGKQLDELEETYKALMTKVDIDSAQGTNLDMLGGIVNISRRDAYDMLDITTMDAMTDEAYRNVLRFKALKNNADATYSDIMKGLYLLWGKDALITYQENPTAAVYNGKAWNKPDPASIAIDIADIPSDVMDPTIIRPMIIKPGGVKIAFSTNYRDRIEIKHWEHFRNVRITYEANHMYNGDFKYDGTISYSRNNHGYYQYNGTLRYNGEAQYHPIDVKYNRYDGKWQYNGAITYGATLEEEAVDDMDAVLLNQAKKKMLKFRAEGSDGWKITHFAFGTGLSANGSRYIPKGDQTALVNEVARTEVVERTKIDDSTYQYMGYIPENKANGKYITEVGLVDSDGDLVCIKTFDKKLKQTGTQMVFKIDDVIDLDF